MAFNLFGNDAINSPDELADRRALIRALVARQLNQPTRNMWDGANKLVGAISSRVAQGQLDQAGIDGKARAETSFAPLIEALRKKQAPDAGTVASVLANPWVNPGQRSIAKALYKQQLNRT
ncbi:hypothetical protein [Taklimakanibacter deserti]|uniref:hypothetical protein n=1 Tax=Taklimakanibacter deserti TaxID=2267839 RepID=UPI000E65CE82